MAALQRSTVPVIREAVEQFISAGKPNEFDCEVDGHTVLVSAAGDNYRIGIYGPGSVPDGDCDEYYTCSEDGEVADTTSCKFAVTCDRYDELPESLTEAIELAMGNGDLSCDDNGDDGLIWYYGYLPSEVAEELADSELVDNFSTKK